MENSPHRSTRSVLLAFAVRLLVVLGVAGLLPRASATPANPYAGNYIGTLHNVYSSADTPDTKLVDVEFSIEADGTFAVTAQFTGTVAGDGTVTFDQPGTGLQTGTINADGVLAASRAYARIDSAHPAHTLRFDATRQGALLPTWQKVDLTSLAPPAGNNWQISTLAQGNGAVVAVISAAGTYADWAALRTTDGITWTHNPITLGITPSSSRTYGSGVRFTGGKFYFAVYGDSYGGPAHTRIYSSDDGITWAGVDTPVSARPILDFATAYGRTWALLSRDLNGKLDVLSSTDGTTWTLSNVGTGISDDAKGFVTDGNTLALFPSTNVSNKIKIVSYITTDGTTWTLGTFTPLNTTIAFGPAGFLGFGYDAAKPNDPLSAKGNVLHSADLTTWTPLTPGPDLTPDEINYYPPFAQLTSYDQQYYALSAVSPGALYRSADGGVWHRIARLVTGATTPYFNDAPRIIGNRVLIACYKEIYATDLISGDGYPIARPPSLLVAPTGSTVASGGAFGLSAAFTGHGLPLAYQWQRDGVDVPGATSANYFVNGATVANSGAYVLKVSNAAGSVTSSSPVTVTVNAPAGPPVITAQPVSATVATGGSVTFSVTATGGTSQYQWRKDGTAIVGANARTYTIASVASTDAADYSVIVYGSSSTVTSAAATLTVTAAPPAGPTLTTGPQNRTATVGGSATFGVEVGGPGPFTYQWLKDGTPIPNATGATLTFASAAATDAGSYTVAITNAGGTITSKPATLTVNAAHDYSGYYFGTFASGGGWALTIHADGSGTYIAYLSDLKAAIVVSFTLTADGTFSVTGTAINPAAVATVRGLALATPEAPATRRAAAAGYTLTGQIDAQGAVTGQLTGLGETFTGAADAASGPAQTSAGSYTASALGTAGGATYAIVSPTGQALIVTTGAVVDSASGTVDATGHLTATTVGGTALALTIDPSAQSVSATLTPAGSSTPITFAGLPDGVASTSRVVNLSVRSAAGSGSQTLIVGFVVSGTGGKNLLLRATGPAIKQYLPTALADPRMRLLDGAGAELDTNNDWDASLQSTITTLGATPYAAGSKDAAILRSLAAGPYSFHAYANDGGTGVVVAELYDADASATPAEVVNISARTQVGTGTDILIAGFVITGNAPKTLLIRGQGPTLTGLGVTGALADPQLYLYQGNTVIATNDNWGGTDALKTAFATVGASALASDTSKDAALLVTLNPGVYSAQVSGVANTTGVALVEIYLLP